MFKLKSGSIKNYTIALIAIFIIVSVLTNIYFFQAIGNISIKSDLYQNIKASQDLKADILPPKLYIVESYLIVQQIANEKDDGKREVLLEKMRMTREDYLSNYAYWQNNINNNDVNKLLISSNALVTEFYKTYDDEFIPAIQKKDYQAMQEIANSKMNPIFEKHRDIIDQMSVILETSNKNIESAAKAFADKSQIILFSVYLISLFIILIISFVILRRVSQTEQDIVDSKHETETTNQRLETMVNGLKKFKHSYENTLASINGYVLRDDYAGLKIYLDEIIAEKNKNEMVNYFKIDFVKNPAITGLVISKIMYAQGQGVELILKVRSEANSISIKTSHLCEILGILLDNAIEAASDSKDKKVYFKIEESKEAFIFEIKNSIEIQPDFDKMFEKNWSTKGENRGFGLWIVKNIINKYENVILNTNVDKNYVEQDLLILKNLAIDQGTYFTDIL